MTISYRDAALIKVALNAALLEPNEGLTARYLTEDERIRLIRAVNEAITKPMDCDHSDWEWPMPMCPGCGIADIRNQPK